MHGDVDEDWYDRGRHVGGVDEGGHTHPPTPTCVDRDRREVSDTKQGIRAAAAASLDVRIQARA